MRLIHYASAPPVPSLDYYERVEGPDKGLINAWVVGLEKRSSWSEAAAKALAGELPVLPYRGGVEKRIKRTDKVGSLQYVAMWQGLRGEDLNLDTDAEISMTCTRTGVPVLFTMDYNKLRADDSAA